MTIFEFIAKTNDPEVLRKAADLLPCDMGLISAVTKPATHDEKYKAKELAIAKAKNLES